PENGLSGVLAIRSGILGSIHRQLNLKHPNATNPGKPGFVSNLKPAAFGLPVFLWCARHGA
ncbi:hypothetical protein, partial [Marinobacter salarius]|uniref:hypothetical protein n=1 Tax=Marinobacter salarius TaxID=1420917 RepID=UPI001BCE3EA4